MPASAARVTPFVRPPRYESPLFSAPLDLPCGHTHMVFLKPVQGSKHSEWAFDGGFSGCFEAEKWANAILPLLTTFLQVLINEEARQHNLYEQKADLIIRTSCLLLHEVADMHTRAQRKVTEVETQFQTMKNACYCWGRHPLVVVNAPMARSSGGHASV